MVFHKSQVSHHKLYFFLSILIYEFLDDLAQVRIFEHQVTSVLHVHEHFQIQILLTILGYLNEHNKVIMNNADALN